MLLGVLYSLAFVRAENMTVGISVTSGSSFTFHLRAVPEKRVRLAGHDNSGTLLTVEVRDPGSLTPLVSDSVVTSSGGTFSGFTVALAPGTYDITAKGYSHLRVKKSNVALAQDITVDFTNNGTSPLLCGDVNGATGDNKVNGIDLTQIVAGLTAYHVRYDVNRDSVVNGLDLTNAVSNLNQLGAN
jgi:hypothetical protein